MNKPSTSPILSKIYHKRLIFQKDRNAYYSGLFSLLKKFIFDEKAAYAKECYFAMEQLGYPPIDVKYALENLRGIQMEPRTRYGNTYSFYFYGSMKRSKKWDKVRRDTIGEKLQVIADYQRRYLNAHKKGRFLENLVYDAILFDTKNLQAAAIRTFRFAGKRDKSGLKEIDAVAYGLKSGKFYAIECKARDSLIGTSYYESELEDHFAKCEVL